MRILNVALAVLPTSPGIVGGTGLGCTTLDFTTPSSPAACAM